MTISTSFNKRNVFFGARYTKSTQLLWISIFHFRIAIRFHNRYRGIKSD